MTFDFIHGHSSTARIVVSKTSDLGSNPGARAKIYIAEKQFTIKKYKQCLKN
ncbi:MAG: hypothetical protein RIQ33_1731 [Bacteroidota bacterium]